MRLKDTFYNTFPHLSILTDDEFNELVHIEQVFTILSNAIPEDPTNALSNYISDYLIERSNRSWELISTAYKREKSILKLCTM